MDRKYPKPLTIHWVTTINSPEFTHLEWALTHSSLVALDAEWKPRASQESDPTNPTLERAFPTVSLLQLAFRLTESTQSNSDESPVFLVDLQSLPFESVYGKLKEMFESERVLKLGFRFKQDLVFLSSTFCCHGCEPGFDEVEPFLDISNIYNLLQQKQPGRRRSKDSKSLATICEELLGVSLSKELQCSDWSLRPLSEEQKTYAAIDAHCLIEIFSIFQAKVDEEGCSVNNVDALQFANLSLGSTDVLEKPTPCNDIVSSTVSAASNLARPTCFKFSRNEASKDVVVSDSFCSQTGPLDDSISTIISAYGSKILLKDSDKHPKISRKKEKKQPAMNLHAKLKGAEWNDDWQGPALWEISNGGDGCPRFLCDVMIEGLAKYLRCVGLDAAVPYSKKPENRELIEQAQKEKRVLLTRDAKLLRFGYLIDNQIYRVKSLLKPDQLAEVIKTFQLQVSENQLMSRCTKCNGMFIQRPLSTEEAIEAAKGFQKIPSCLFRKNLEFWQCKDCKQLYWEGTQYDNAKQKFNDFVTSVTD